MQHYIKGIPVSKEVYDEYQLKQKKKKRTILLVVSIFIIGTIGLFIASFIGGKYLIKKSDAYHIAEEVIQKNKEIKEITGDIEDIDFSSGSIHTSNGDGEASLYLDVEGEKKDVTVYLYLSKENGEWVTHDIEIEE
ncbi:hypothetical protein GCM10007424_13290 [Flavobacterium suaedae]|uniref:Cytochrome oxidase complex assembly protein 1 n=1 Tax=Flavobacterium suaedae TaxID=1767027 RepID=A0ABQ1JQG0_9FLAO|nr:cytochrome c oxidase assembly factor Coa1 family protein [Flavobacterium suaedae]GGB74690.1 hypothetical protein GCM10007424_13290 [Flavobacterium suaedae]